MLTLAPLSKTRAWGEIFDLGTDLTTLLTFEGIRELIILLTKSTLWKGEVLGVEGDSNDLCLSTKAIIDLKRRYHPSF